MTEQNQDKEVGRFKQLWLTWRGWLLPTLLLLAVVAVLAVLGWTGVINTGFGEYVPDPTVKPDPERAKTLWDWLELLLVPGLLAIGAFLLNRAASAREHEAQKSRIEEQREIERRFEERRITEQRLIEADRARETALQIYLDRMTELIRDGLPKSEPGDAQRSIARAQTMRVLRQLDGQRKGLLLQFLYDAGLVGQLGPGEEGQRAPIIDLRGAFLYGATLLVANLPGVHLNETDLREADLPWADLRGANLSRAILFGANLTNANLGWANLTGTHLVGKDSQQPGAWMEDADLSHADLSSAKVMREQLAQARSLEGTTLPDGTVHE